MKPVLPQNPNWFFCKCGMRPICKDLCKIQAGSGLNSGFSCYSLASQIEHAPRNALNLRSWMVVFLSIPPSND